MDSSISPTTKPIYRGTQIVWFVLATIEIMLGFRIILKCFAANPFAGFSLFIYGITYPFAAPFLAVFGKTQIEGSIFEWSTLLAMVFYWIVGIMTIKLFLMSKSVSTPEAAVELEKQEAATTVIPDVNTPPV